MTRDVENATFMPCGPDTKVRVRANSYGGGRRFTGGEAWRFRVEAGEDAGGAVCR